MQVWLKKSSQLVLAVNYMQMRCISHSHDLSEMHFENNVVSHEFNTLYRAEAPYIDLTTCCLCCNPICNKAQYVSKFPLAVSVSLQMFSKHTKKHIGLQTAHIKTGHLAFKSFYH